MVRRSFKGLSARSALWKGVKRDEKEVNTSNFKIIDTHKSEQSKYKELNKTELLICTIRSPGVQKIKPSCIQKSDHPCHISAPQVSPLDGEAPTS
jgi:hypothetical protein